MAGRLRSAKGSALLWVLLLAMLALLAGGGIARLLIQREAMIRADYALLRAVCNAENGLEWARLRWLEALVGGEDTSISGLWTVMDAATDLDRAEVKLTKRGDGTWEVMSVGSFMESRRRLDAVLPDFRPGVAAVLAITDLVAGNGTLSLTSEMTERYFIDPGRVSGVSVQMQSQVERSFANNAPPMLVSIPPLETVQKYAGDYREGLDGELLELATLQTTLQHLWPGTEPYATIACAGRLQLGQDPEQLHYLSEGRLVLVAEDIEIIGSIDLNLEAGAELWLLATRSITWTVSTLNERSFRGLIWSPGMVYLRGAPQASWAINGAIFAGRLYLENFHLAWRDPVDLDLPEESLPRELTLPRLHHLRVMAPGS